MTGSEALIRRIYDEGFNQGVERVFDECYADDFVHHSKVIHDVAPGGQGEKESMLRFRAAIPDVRFEILELLGDGERVAARLRITGGAVEAFGTVPAGTVDIHAVAWFVTVEREGRTQVREEWLFTDAAA